MSEVQKVINNRIGFCCTMFSSYKKRKLRPHTLIFKGLYFYLLFIFFPAATLGFAELHNQLKHLRKIPDVINTGDTYYSLTK